MDDEFHAISLCIVVSDFNTGKPMLERIADLDESGKTFIKFTQDLTQTPQYRNMYGNRKQFDPPKRGQKGPSQEGASGVWSWTAKQHLRYPDKDYPESCFCPKISPIEAIQIPSEYSFDDYMKKMCEGVPNLFESHDYFIYLQNDDKLDGVLCRHGELEANGSLLRLEQNVNVLPHYELSASNFLNFQTNQGLRVFCRDIQLDQSDEKAPVRPEPEIVRNILQRHTKNSNLEKLYIPRSQQKTVREFLQTFRIENIFKEVADECGCTYDDAEGYVTRFVENAENTLSGGDEDTRLFESMIEANTELAKKYSELAEEKWREDNKEKCQEAEQHLEQVNTRVESEQSRLESLQKQTAEEERRLTSLKRQTEEAAAIGERTAAAVRLRLEEARYDVGTFLAQRIICGAAVPSGHPIASAIERENASFLPGRSLSGELGQPEDSLQTLKNICAELEHAGVGAMRRKMLAAFLYVSVLEKEPLLLAGPAAEQIADALSAAIYGSTAGRLICRGRWNQDIFDKSAGSADQIVVIENVWDERWIDILCSKLWTAGKTFIVTTPYAEELAAEPAGFYNYIFPLFTDYFVESFPDCDWTGALQSGSYPVPESSASIRREVGALCRRLPISDFSAGRLKKLLSAASAMAGDTYAKALPYYCGILPITILLGRQKRLADEIRSDTNMDQQDKNDFLHLLGEEDE